MHTQNEALLAKWLWKLPTQPDSPWVALPDRLYGTTSYADLLHNATASEVLRSLVHLQPFISVYMERDTAIQLGWCWCWSTDGVFSTGSAYKVMHNSGVNTRIQRSGLGCHLCCLQIIETAEHLLFTCSYTVQFWAMVMSTFNLPLLNSNNLADSWWEHRRHLMPERRYGMWSGQGFAGPCGESMTGACFHSRADLLACWYTMQSQR